MKLFLEFVVVLLASELNECLYLPEVKPAQFPIWPRVKNEFQDQSPVNIITHNAQRSYLDPLNIHFCWDSLREISIAIKNTGRYLEVLLPEEVEEKPFATGGPLLEEKYIFEQFHFHWGQTDDCGCENRLDGKFFPTEIHAVFHHEMYGSFEKATSYPDGVAVVAFFGEQNLKNTDNPNLRDLISKIPDVIQPGTNTTASFKTGFEFLRGIISQQTYYYTFPGSLTTSPFQKCVTWIVFPQPFEISSAQVCAFRNLMAKDDKPLKENNHPIQDFNNRPLLIQPYHLDE